MSKSEQSIELPTTPPPIYTAQPKAQDVISTQPTAVTQMSVEDPEILRLRGGCGCLVGGLDVETGPCVCHTTGYGFAASLASSSSSRTASLEG
ncbi:hypothetical protein DL93DRAFT_2173739 [Clavulina sp. PMI_390]|nr:hypothetical protein DL93DRAFT_2173739 [Clavulina sp. PMI_390]